MSLYRCEWLLPIAQPPIRDAWIRTEGERIVAFGPVTRGDLTGDVIDLEDSAVLPGLVNAHTHLELSWMRGRIPHIDSFPEWIRSVIALRAAAPQPDVLERAIASAIEEACRYGTALLGDISNTLLPYDALRDSSLAALLFHELIAFASDKAATIASRGREAIGALAETDRLRCTLSPHAPYSVSPALFREIRSAAIARSGRWSVHLAESEAELHFLRDGGGPFRELLDHVGAWDESWAPPGRGPVEYLDRMDLLDDRLLVVHGVQLTSGELRRLAETRTTLVTCPRGNRATGAGTPPIAEFFASGVRVAVGTDSLASVPDLNVFAEIAEMRRLAPAVPAARLLESATVNGAEALGFGSDFGTIERGKRNRLIAIDVGKSERDVAECLVSGVEADRVEWL
jgi:cytosine/adenosine deaminase-related metal-dependent hydrolase